MALDAETKEELLELLKQVVSEAVEVHPLSNEEVEWVRLAIQSEANRAAFRKAVIEKTFIALLGSGFLALFGYAANFFKDHWKM